jgi:amino acid adenylation domain-containing protein
MIKQRSTLDFLSHLRTLDIHLALKDDQLACSAPKGVLSAALTAELRARKSEIIDFLRTTTGESSRLESPLAPLHRDGPRIPSLAQQRLWFLEQFDQDNTAYNISCGLRFRGALDFDVLNRSFRELIRRHEVLRTNLVDVDGSVKGVVQACPEWKLSVRSLLETPADQREAELQRVVAEEVQRKFDLRRDVLARGCLVVLGAEDHALIIVMHHIAADGQSLGIFNAELMQLYEAFRKGEDSPLPELSLQYADYADWHRQNMDNGAFQPEILYWRQKLRGPLPVTDLPTDRPRQAMMTYKGSFATQMLDAPMYEAIRSFATARKATPFVVLMAAYKILLVRYTSQTDVIVGSAAAGRSRRELEPLMGLFINNLVLRTDLSADPSGEEAISRERDTVLNAFANEHVTLDRLLDVLKPNRELNRSPLFQVMFILHTFPFSWPQLPDLSIEILEFDPGSTRYELTVEAFEDQEQRLRLAWQYNTDLFDASTIERMQQSYMQILEQLVAEPQRRISEFQILSPAEQKRLLPAAERTAYPELCAHQLFALQAERTPSATAVVCGEERLSYKELQVRVNRLAHRLRAMGVGPDVLAAVCLPRSADMLVAVLAVLTAGGGYVPLDPEYPFERLEYMLTDSGAVVLVTEEPVLQKLPFVSVPSICLDRDRSLLLNEDATSPNAGASPSHLAYVIYTSGSTGKPKGVEISHRAVVNLLAFFARQFNAGPEDRLLAVTTLSFDIAGLELYLPLICGAQVILATREEVWDGVRLAALIRRYEATMMQATPVTWRLLLDAGWTGSPEFRILCGGEALPPELADRLMETGGELWNLYGPTETTIWSTAHRVDTHDGVVPIGKPIANTETYVLDANRRLTPVGVVGELYIGGDGLARGYRGRPELTTEKFVPHPFDPGERLYRTGDLARWLADGNLQCLGRLDHQIKLRGFRIELGEIEVALEQQPGIQHAVVVLQGENSADARLIAYVVTESGASVDTGGLREALSGRLSNYMVPAAFIRIDELPLTPNKKVDRKALAARPVEAAVSSRSYLPPRTDAEQRVAAIWRDLLRTEQAGISDNFFDLGGHSLLVVQLQSRLRRDFGKEVSLVELFQHPTIASQAALVVGREASEPVSTVGLAIAGNRS